MKVKSLSIVGLDLNRFFNVKENLNHLVQVTGFGMCVTPEPITGTETVYNIGYIIETYTGQKQIIEIGQYNTNDEIVVCYSDEYLQEFMDEVEYFESITD